MSQAESEGLEVRQRHLRAKLIVTTFHKMVDGWSAEEREACVLNEEIVWATVNSYFLDIKRKKEFHGIEYADAHKRASYMMKWIMRYRPVQIVRKSTKRVYMVNELLATAHALKMLNVPANRVPTTLREHLLYLLRYRTVEPNALAMTFYLMEQSFGEHPTPAH